MKIYMLPGLGFDNRIFQKLNFPSKYQAVALDWDEPESGESLHKYARKFSEKMESESPIVLIGHSMGGMLSQEISHIINVDRIFLISSIKSRAELPPHFKAVSPLKLYRFFTKKLVLNSFGRWGKWHDYDTPEEQALFKDMVNNNSDDYLQWALNELSKWQPVPVPKRTTIYHIHGNRDRTLPSTFVKPPVHIIEGGGHFMVYKRAEEISKIISERLVSIK